jgi:hypothetical protein
MMKIAEQYADYEIEIIEITEAKYLGNFVVDIRFNDGSTHLVNFRPFLESSVHPSIRKYLDEERFRRYRLVDGNLNWNDYDMIFPIADLHDGVIA